MKTKFLGLLAAGLLAGPITASAVPTVLTATPVDSRFTGFTVTFDDTGNGLLDFSEVTAFSGVTFSNIVSSPSDGLYSLLLGIPPITGVANCGSASGCNNTRDWRFGRAGFTVNDIQPPQGLWTYSLSIAAVPEPGTLALLSLGLVGFGLSRRRKAAS